MTSTSEDWAQRYATRDTPWDLGDAHPEIVARIAAGLVPASASSARAWVPGCGRGHDALALARAGWRVSAMDFADATQGDLNLRLAEFGGRFLLGDVLESALEERFDLVLDHTFFCALDPRLRARWGAAIGRSLAPAGRVCALVFPVGKPASEGGPPYGCSTQDLQAALGPEFRAQLDEPCLHRAQKRSWAERWAVFARED